MSKKVDYKARRKAGRSEVFKAMERHKGYYLVRYKRPISDEELLERLALIPREDTRDLTGRLMGDPMPGDRRREQCNTLEDVSFAEELT